MNPETSEFRMDGMSVHPDWNHVETLTIHPDSDTLIIVPGHALFKSTTYVSSPDFDPLQTRFWSLNEFQDDYELRLLIEHIHVGVITATKKQKSILVFSGGCTRQEAEGWTEGASYYEVADYYDWWRDETELAFYQIKSKCFADVYAIDSFDNVWMSIRLFQVAHPRQEVPKRVVVVNYAFKEMLFQHHASVLGIPEFEYIGLEDPVNIVQDASAHARMHQTLASYKQDPFVEDVNSYVGKKKLQRNIFDIAYPFGTARDVHKSYVKQFQRRKAMSHLR